MLTESIIFPLSSSVEDMVFLCNLLSSIMYLIHKEVLCFLPKFFLHFTVTSFISKDTVRNPVEFPNSFIEGSWEGFWWAFITMTTVG